MLLQSICTLKSPSAEIFFKLHSNHIFLANAETIYWHAVPKGPN